MSTTTSPDVSDEMAGAAGVAAPGAGGESGAAHATDRGEIVLSVKDVSKVFPQGTLFSRRYVNALKHVSFDLHKGEIVSLVGESGSGKSTAARVVARLERPTSGTFELNGEVINAKTRRRAPLSYRKHVQMVFQDPFGSLNPNARVDHFLERPLKLHGLVKGGADLRKREEELMEMVGLDPSMLESFPHQLSGGQRQRVAIARALSVEPTVILADEPTSMLDVSVRIGVLNLMRDLADQQGISIIFITHDLASARYIADRTMVMYSGEIVEYGEALDIMGNPAHPYTKLLTSAVPDPHRARSLQPEARAALREQIRGAMYGTGTAKDPQVGMSPVYENVRGDHWVRVLEPTSRLKETA